ncbi:MAG: hypothetical protein R3D46_04120 [Defluviimonas denitrificans]
MTSAFPTRARVILSAGFCLMLAACSQPRAHAALRVTPDGVRVAPSLSTTIAGIGVSVSQ